MRFTQQHVDQWREDGFCVIEDFFTPDEITPVLSDYETLYQQAMQPVGHNTVKVVDAEHEDADTNGGMQFQNIHTLPYNASVETNLISLHPQLIAFARALLGTEDVHCYQSHTWAKFTGQADYEQNFHCDFGNHTLTVPSDRPDERTVDFVFYLTEVTKAHGALHYVTKSDVKKALGRPALAAPDDEEQVALRAFERAVEVPAGGLVAHGIDTMHRGTNLTIENGRRFSMTVGYKAAGNENIAYHAWQTGANKPWDKIINHGTPEQLEMLGIPKPGNHYWTLRTLKLTQARWPEWNMRDYFEASDILP